jgi:stage II sporulation protein D
MRHPRPALVACAWLLLSFAGVRLAQAQPPLAALPPVKVHLAALGSPRALTLRPAGELRITDAGTGQPLEAPAGPLTITAAGKELKIGETTAASVRVEAETLTVEVGRSRRVYPAALLLTAASGRLTITNECPLEQYVEGVLSAECPSLFHAEAIKAMAVAVRSYSYRKAYLGRAELCDATHCQVYPGVGNVKPAIREAVRETAGLCATYHGEVIDAVYSSDCGGYTEGNEDAWKGARAVPYLRPVEDAPEPHGEPYCAVNRTHSWKLLLPPARLQSLLGKAGAAVRLEIADTTASGRVKRVQLESVTLAAPPQDESLAQDAPAKEAIRLISGEELRRVLGTAAVKSLLFSARETEQGVELEGRGWGHGVGLCQFGAQGMARQGVPYSEILKHYYTDVEIGPAPVPVGMR